MLIAASRAAAFIASITLSSLPSSSSVSTISGLTRVVFMLKRLPTRNFLSLHIDLKVFVKYKEIRKKPHVNVNAAIGIDTGGTLNDNVAQSRLTPNRKSPKVIFVETFTRISTAEEIAIYTPMMP